MFFLYVFFAFFPFIHFSSAPALNFFAGFGFYLALPIALASLWTGIGLFIRHYQNVNPVILFVGLVLFPLSLSVLLALGLVFLIPEFRRYRKGAFPKGNSFSKKGKRFVRFVGLVYLALFLLATLAASFSFLFSEKTHFLISLIGVLSLFFSIAIFTFACAFLAKKEETIA